MPAVPCQGEAIEGKKASSPVKTAAQINTEENVKVSHYWSDLHKETD